MTEKVETGGPENGFTFGNESRNLEALLSVSSADRVEGDAAMKRKVSVTTWDRKVSGRNFIWSSVYQSLLQLQESENDPWDAAFSGLLIASSQPALEKGMGVIGVAW